MATINAGYARCYSASSTSYGYYLIQVDYSGTSRSGTTVTVTGVTIRATRQGTGYTTNGIRCSASCGNQSFSAAQVNNVGSNSPASWSRALGTCTFTGVAASTSSVGCWVDFYAHNSSGTRLATPLTTTVNIGVPTAGSPSYNSVTASNVGRTTATITTSANAGANASLVTVGHDVGLNTSSFTFYNSNPTNLTGLTPNTTYYFRGYITNSAGLGLNSGWSSFKTTGNAPSITNVTKTPSRTTATITLAVSYDTNASFSSMSIRYGTTTSYGSTSTNGNLTGLSPNTTYYYSATVTDNQGRTSAASTGSFKTTANAPAIGTPTATTTQTTATINVTATPDTNVSISSYRTYYRINGTTSYSNVSGKVISNLRPATTYDYYVVATDSLGKTATTNTLTFKTGAISIPTASEVSVHLSQNESTRNLTTAVTGTIDPLYRCYYTVVLKSDNDISHITYNDFMTASYYKEYTFNYITGGTYIAEMTCYYALVDDPTIHGESAVFYSNEVNVNVGPQFCVKTDSEIQRYTLYESCPTPRLGLKAGNDIFYLPLELSNVNNLVVKQGMATPPTDTYFWSSYSSGYLTPLEDGWVKSYIDTPRTTEGYSNTFMKPTSIAGLKPDTLYTIVYEFKDYTFAGGGRFNIGNTAASTTTSQFTRSTSIEMYDIEKLINNSLDGIGRMARTLTTKSEPEFSNATISMRNFITYGVGSQGGVSFRMMVIEGDYTGVNFAYTPYTPNRNLFNKNDASLIKPIIVDASSLNVIGNANSKTIVMPCEPNTTYTASKVLSTNRFQFASSPTEPVVGSTVTAKYKESYENNDMGLTYTTGANDRFLMLFFFNSGAQPTADYQAILNGIKIELGSTATGYVEYTSGDPIIPTRLKLRNGNTLYQLNREFIQPSKIITETGNTITTEDNDSIILENDTQTIKYKLKFSGTQYIDTGFVPNGASTKVEIEALCDTYTTRWLFGARTAIGSNAYCFLYTSPTTFRADYAGNSDATTYNFDSAKRKIVLDKNNFYIDNTLLRTYTLSNFTPNVPFYLGTANTNNVPQGDDQKFRGEIYSCRIWDGDKVVRNLIPVKPSKNICPSEIEFWEMGHYSLINGNKEDYIDRLRLKELLRVEPSTKYYVNTFDKRANFAQFVVRTYDINKVFVRSIGGVVSGSAINTQDNEYYIGVALYYPISPSPLPSFQDYEQKFAQGILKPFICKDSILDKGFTPYTAPSNCMWCTVTRKFYENKGTGNFEIEEVQ